MSLLEDARKKINSVDKEMAKLFYERMKAVEVVFEHKKKHGLPIYDKDREQDVIAKNVKYIEDGAICDYYVDFIKNVMELSKNYQYRLQQGLKIAYSGVEGAFAQIAANRIFPDGQKISERDFKAAYRDVENGKCDVAVLPIENSYAGEVGGVIDLMFSGSLYVNGVYKLEIIQNLLGVEGASLSDIKTVISHPQALSQCGEYIHEHGLNVIEATNTAVAGKYVFETNDKTVAAIASMDTARLYNLNVLDHDINKSNSNTTRFAVLSKSKYKGDNNNNSILMFTVSNEAGALVKAIDVIGKHKFNMTALRSRPMKEQSWQYYFYVELDANVETPNGEKMIEELRKYCDKLKVLGTFCDNVIL